MADIETPRRRALEYAVTRLVLLGGLPAVLAALILLWTGDYGVEIRWTLTVALPSVWLGCAAAAHNRVVRPMQLLVNLLGALREGDFSLRGAGADAGDALGDVVREVNALGDTLHRQRLSAVEATALLWNVLSEIDGASRPGAGAADRIVALAQRAQQVGLKVQRTRDHLERRCRAADPDYEHDGRHGPAHFEAVGLIPRQEEERERRRKPGHQHEQRD